MPDETNRLRSLYVIYDLVAETWIGQPIVDRHSAPVCRMFNALLADTKTQLYQHPGDFTLLHIGYIDDNGQLTEVAPVTISTGEAWLAMQKDAANVSE